MTMCPVPGCKKEAPKSNVFCPDCYFLIPAIYTRSVNRIKFACSRAEDDDTRQHLQRQLRGYISVAISKIPGGSRAA